MGSMVRGEWNFFVQHCSQRRQSRQLRQAVKHSACLRSLIVLRLSLRLGHARCWPWCDTVHTAERRGRHTTRRKT